MADVAPQETYAIPLPVRDYRPEHFLLEVTGKTATVTLNRPDRKNPLTFQSYAELRDLFRALQFDEEVKTIVVTGAGGNFCSGGDVFEIIEPLLSRDMPGLFAVHHNDRRVGQGDAGVSAADCRRDRRRLCRSRCDHRHGLRSQGRHGEGQGRLPVQPVGLAGCDMGACAILRASSATAGRPSFSTPVA